MGNIFSYENEKNDSISHDLDTGLSLVRKINILLRVCKTGKKVCILHARHTFRLVVYIFFERKIF